MAWMVLHLFSHSPTFTHPVHIIWQCHINGRKSLLHFILSQPQSAFMYGLNTTCYRKAWKIPTLFVCVCFSMWPTPKHEIAWLPALNQSLFPLSMFLGQLERKRKGYSMNKGGWCVCVGVCVGIYLWVCLGDACCVALMIPSAHGFPAVIQKMAVH